MENEEEGKVGEGRRRLCSKARAIVAVGGGDILSTVGGIS